MDSLRALNWVISLCGIVIMFASAHVGRMLAFQPGEDQTPLMLLMAALSIVALVGAFGRTREESDMPRYERQTKMVVFSAAVTLLLILLVLLGFLPFGMDPAVPFLFVIPVPALVMVLILPIEVIWRMQEAYIDRLADEVLKRIEERQSE
ncbi:hypothetical protein EU538_13105 [Candidatus Thorarchaeota archaeon]|nr:MAG: hypothetical protein EU538_13105 [Candidatus Thorarchaeota archaeon]